MAVTAIVFNPAKKKLMEGAFNLTSDTIKVALCTSSFSPNIDLMDFFDDVTNEVVSAGYTAGGATLTSPTITVDTVNDLAYFDAADTSWSGVTFTYRYIVIYKSTGIASTSPLLAYVDLGADRSNSGDTAYLQWATTGIFKIT
jgi:hypothetical protein